MTATRHALHEFMPYGAPDLLADAPRSLTRAMSAAMAGLLGLFALLVALSGLGFGAHSPIDVPFVRPAIDLVPPPPLVELFTPPAPIAVTRATRTSVPVPVPDAQVREPSIIASQQELSQGEASAHAGEGGPAVAPPPVARPYPSLNDWVPTDELPEVITAVQPVYPEFAREAQVDGTVMLRALVGADGRVKDVHVDRSIPMLDAAAVAAVRQWVFKPALSDNHAVAVWVAIPVRFTLH